MAVERNLPRWVVAAVLIAAASLGCQPVAQVDSKPADPPGPSATRIKPAAKADLVAELVHGGYVIYVRHTATDATPDDPTPNLADPSTQRGLSVEGRAQARGIGRAFMRLGIPLGAVWVSPYARTRETADLAFGPGRGRSTDDLVNEIFPGTDDAELARKLRTRLARRPAAGTNTVMVSHGFNLRRATGLSTGEGDTVIFKPAGGSRFVHVATISPSEWARWARGGG